LHQSLINTCPNFTLYIFSFDDKVHQVLSGKKLLNVIVVPLADVENQELSKVKTERSTAEYCWTCKPFIVQYIIDKFNADNCTYLDSDTFFYKNPNILIEEMGNASVLISPHNYLPRYNQSAMSGIYCGQLLTFKRTADGLKILAWWKNACLTWCYDRYEDGKMSDQKYLDSWPYMFRGVHVCRNPGAGWAPWNADGHKKEDIENLIFYHFHDLKYLSDSRWYLSGYDTPKFIVEKIYSPYIALLKAISNEFDCPAALGPVSIDSFRMLNVTYRVKDYLRGIITAIENLTDAVFYIKKRRFYRNNFIKSGSPTIVESK